MNFTVESGGMKELKFGSVLTCISLVENFVYNETYFKLHPVWDWEPIYFFQLRGNVREFYRIATTLLSEFWTKCNFLNSKSVSDRYRELQ